MKCERCGEDAVVHFTQITGGEMKTTHLCETCAAEKGLDPNPPTPSFQLSDLLGQMGTGPQGTAASVVSGACGFCGLELPDFKETGRFGCPHCYTSFEKGVRGLLRRIHGSTQHVGKVYLPDSSYREMTEWAMPAERQVEYDRVSSRLVSRTPRAVLVRARWRRLGSPLGVARGVP